MTATEDMPSSVAIPVNGKDEKRPTPIKPITISSYFKDKGIHINFCLDREAPIAPIESLAFSIAVNYVRTKPFIRHIRDCITRKTFDFTYAFPAAVSPERSATVDLAKKFYDYGILVEYHYDKPTATIRGTISTAPSVINFINGNFLECYAKCTTDTVLKNAAKKYGCDYEIYNNVFIEKDNERHELDLVFRVGKYVFWAEVKSGKVNPDTYRKLGTHIGFVPDRLILLAAEKTDDMCASISYFYEYYAANIAAFKSSLINMIDKAFTEEETI